MTNCGEIWPLWSKVSNLMQNFKGFFSVWQNFERTWAKFYVLGQIFIVVNGQILINNLATLSHWYLSSSSFALSFIKLYSVHFSQSNFSFIYLADLFRRYKNNLNHLPTYSRSVASAEHFFCHSDHLPIVKRSLCLLNLSNCRLPSALLKLCEIFSI